MVTRGVVPLPPIAVLPVPRGPGFVTAAPDPAPDEEGAGNGALTPLPAGFGAIPPLPGFSTVRMADSPAVGGAVPGLPPPGLFTARAVPYDRVGPVSDGKLTGGTPVAYAVAQPSTFRV